jgi:hypothetical protein
MARAARASRATAASRATRRTALAFDALLVEGALIAPAQLARIAALDAGDQKPADYSVRKGLELRDELPLFYRIGQALFAELVASPTPSQTATVAFTQALLRDVFGFTDIAPRPGVTLAALDGRVPVVVVPPTDGLDRPSATLSTTVGHRTSAALTVQDWLNAQDGALWGLACNGERLRLLRDNPSLTRPAYIEADLRRIFEADSLADFAALWLLMHASRFGAPGTPPTDCILERWREAGQKAGEAARERLRDGVERALQEIGDGLLSHPVNGPLRERLASGDLPLPNFFGQLLRLIYRMIFLLAAEDRGLLHLPEATPAARSLYATGYSLSRLRDSAVRPAAWDAHDDLWDGICILFAALARGEPRLGLPALDGLFAHGETPDLENAALSNRALLSAVRGLAWLDGDGAPIPVNWRDMETQELGSVYESLLELTPVLIQGGRAFTFADGAATRGHQRKTTGSYYTPDSLVQALLASALDPVLERVQAEADDPAEALLSVKVLDPACGSGHFLLAAGRHIAARLARLRSGGTAGAEEYRHALRDVARSCLHGVDRNPMAVELAKVALWIETVEPGKPLGFLDANLRAGDSLFGVFDLDSLRLGIPDAAYKPLAGDDRIACRALDARNKAERRGQGALDFRTGGGRLPPAAPLARAAQLWRALPEDSPEQIAAKRSRFEASRADPNAYALRVACDLYVAAFLSPKPAGIDAGNTTLVPTTAAVWQRATGNQIYGPLEGRSVDLARTAGAFHWPLEFPEVMAAGGFNVVLGNPPWDRIKLQEQEFFAAQAQEIATAANAAERGRMIFELRRAADGTRERAIYQAFETAKRTAEASSKFARVPGGEGGRFPLTGRGDVNTYSLFAELFAHATSQSGRAGVIIPTGIATDATTAPFFANLVANQKLISLYSFKEIRHWFVATDDRNPFSLLTIGGADQATDFAFSLKNTEEIPGKRFRLSGADIARINPNTLTAPIFRSHGDALLTRSIYDRVPVLIRLSEESGNPWGISLMRMFDMATDSGLFRTSEQLAAEGLVRDGVDWVGQPGIAPRQAVLAIAGGRDTVSLPLDGAPAQRRRYVPLYEAKMIHQFDHRWATYDGSEARDSTLAEKRDPDFEPTPRYWLPATEVTAALPAHVRSRGWLMGWRDICRSTDERTMITSIIPFTAVGHTTPLLMCQLPSPKQAALFANFNSIVLDYIARQKIGGTHLTYGFLMQFAVLPPSRYSDAALNYVVPRVLELTYTSHALAPFARDLGFDGPPFLWDEVRRPLLRAELDAWYARAYGLTRDELRYILDPTDIHRPDYPSETFRVLKENEIRRYQEYRTRRLVLEAWDRLRDGA